MDKEQQILALIRENPFISQRELAERMGLSRSAVAGYISQLMKKGKIVGRAYVLPDEARVTCIGGANVDRKTQTLEPIRFGTSNPVRVRQSPGGVARNVAENLARLGLAVSLFTVVGDDGEGTWLLNETKRLGVDISLSHVLAHRRTGTYTAVLDPSGELIVALADMKICDEIGPAEIDARWSRIASSRMIVLDANLPEAAIAHLVERCRQEELPLCVNPVSAVKARKLPGSLDGVDILFANRHEAEALTGIAVQSIADAREATLRLMERGAKRVVLTLGEQGLYWATPGESGHQAPVSVRVADVTGAGDALLAGVIFGLLRGEPFPDACRLGMAAAALTLQSEDTVAELTAERLYAILTPDRDKEA